ncbi:hypothetical protein ABW19_dt0208037 [Dactylella cylindrospora]|nr:hypothetical protein ABW19_dt0208037 [Dactylella cylindrospora]
MDPPSSVDYKRHRLPTRSAAAALATQLDPEHGGFNTGSEALDKAFGGSGLEKGKLLELCGPPGSGKTAIALQLVVDAVAKGEQVCWIDTLSQCPTSRLASLLAEQNLQSKLSSIIRYQVTSLAHFFALMIHSMNAHAGTSLMIIDNISSLFTKEFPPAADGQAGSVPNKSASSNGGGGGGAGMAGKEKFEKPADKRGRLVADIANGLQRFSASRMVAIVVLNQLTTRGAAGGGPLELAPSVNSANYSWSNAFHHRILLLRKHVPKTDPLMVKRHLRFVFVLKSAGVEIQNTNLSRPDQFFVIKVTKNGVEDDKQQVFNAASGAISMAEAFTLSGQDSEENYLYDFSDGELDVNSPVTADLSLEGGVNLKRKRSENSFGGSSSSRRSNNGRNNSGSEDEAEADTDSETEKGPTANPAQQSPEIPPADDSSNPKSTEEILESGAGVFPVLSQAFRARRAAGAHEGAERAGSTATGKATATMTTTATAKASAPEIPQRFGRMIVPDSDGESDDDVL